VRFISNNGVYCCFSVATNIVSPPPDDGSVIANTPLTDVLTGTENLNLNKRPNLTIFQKAKPEPVPESNKKTPTKKKAKKDENKVDLWDLMKSAGV